MKAFKAAAALWTLCVGLTAWGAFVQPESIPYYGQTFYDRLRSGSQNDDLKATLVDVLRSAHRSQNGRLDEVTPTCSGAGCYQHVSIGYGRARVFLMGSFYLVNKGQSYAVRDVYCQREYNESEFVHKKPGPSQVPDDTIINVEHTWPQSKFTGRFPEDMQKSDLHHLFPTDSKMNSARSSFAFGEVTQDKADLNCKTGRLGTSSQSRELNFEPPTVHKGNVARALFYFSIKYGMKIDPLQESFLRKWNHDDPVDDEEIRRNQEIFKLQGNRNPFVDYPELADRISDF